MPIQMPRDLVGSGRSGLVWQLLAGVIQTPIPTRSPPVRVLDCGGGSGSFAVPLAQLGATVTVVDISVDALATLSRRADEAGVASAVVPIQGDVESLADAIGVATFDLVLAHGVLAVVDDPAATFAAIVAAIAPDGLLSVLVANPVASVLSKALAGETIVALTELRALDSDAKTPGPTAVQALCRGAGLIVEQVHGVGVYSELVRGGSLELPGVRDALADLETESATRSPFAEIAAKVHVLARRPVG
ncbi:MAG: methyltransferase domain-containing protein [Jatrophihabitantaceae bacterium]